jgi:hypothetical protein
LSQVSAKEVKPGSILVTLSRWILGFNNISVNAYFTQNGKKTKSLLNPIVFTRTKQALFEHY